MTKIRYTLNSMHRIRYVVPPVGLEPTTHDLKGRCSNQLS